jgi:hypothetical protein
MIWSMMPKNQRSSQPRPVTLLSLHYRVLAMQFVSQFHPHLASSKPKVDLPHSVILEVKVQPSPGFASKSLNNA